MWLIFQSLAKSKLLQFIQVDHTHRGKLS